MNSPRFNAVGEEWSINPLVIAYWQKGKANRDGYASDLPSLMDFPFAERARQRFARGGKLVFRTDQAIRNSDQRCALSRSQQPGHFRGQPRHAPAFICNWGRM